MNKRIPLWVIITGAVLFAILFHMKPAGLNLLLFNAFVIGIFLAVKRINFRNFHHVILALGTVITAVFSVLTHSGLCIFMNYMSMILLSAAAVFSESRSIIDMAGIKMLNVFYGFQDFFSRFAAVEQKPGFLRKLWKIIKIAAIPLVIIIIFIAIYRGANPWFDTIAGDFFGAINEFLYSIFGEIDWWWMVTFFLGLLFLIWLLLGKAHPGIVSFESKAEDMLSRRRRKYRYRGKKTALKTELRSAILLLASLNTILLIVNSLDIINVWFGFEWEGEFLKQFVHEGTWLLIFSILISIGIVLFYFRRNLNFLSTNKILKVLAYIWLAQNIILAVSVAIRNIHYINYFNLAYKRIGVMFFLLAVIIGIVTVILKIRRPKTAFFLLRYNALNIYLVFLAMSLFNWDVIIAKYNFSHADSAFVHYNYMCSLSNRALPYLEKTTAELERVGDIQSELFDFASDGIYITSDDYYFTIEQRIERFVNEYPDRHWLSWNYADHKAYRMLTE